MKIKRPDAARIIEFVGSRRFFLITVGLLIFQAVWIALSSRYAMAFDEDFHLGIIRLYAHHTNPFWTGPVPGSEAFGAVARDPSYLYHFLMSFPYRLINFFTYNQAVQVLLLRAINIGLFAWALTIYRRLLLKTGASKAVVNLSLFVVVLLPVTSLLAAQINYDNLLIPLAGLALLLTLKVRDDLARKKIDARLTLTLLILCLLTSLVKYAFLPMFAVIVAYLLIYFWKTKPKVPDFSLKNWLNIGLVLALLVSGGLFVERYGINLIKYHKPVADCGEVLDYQHCQYYGPWIRDYNFKISKTTNDRDPVSYTQHWIYGMWLRTMFAVGGPNTNFETRGPLIIPGVTLIVMAVLGAGAFLLKAKQVWRKYNQPALWLMTSVISVYVISLWLEEFRLFVETGQPVAINGRYLLPVLPLISTLAALAVRELTLKRRQLQVVVASLLILGLIWGGGVLTYILRSGDAWYWNNGAVKSANHAVKNVLGPITPGYRNPIQSLH
jgi:hypothetical protein